MNRIAVISIICVLFFFLIVVKLTNNKTIAEERVFKKIEDEKTLVKTYTAKKNEFGFSKSYIGTFKANKEVVVFPEAQGKIVSLNFKEGDFVEKSQVLLQLDKQILEAQLLSAKASYEDAALDVKRYTNAAKGEAIPQVQLEKAKLTASVAESQLRVLETQITKTTIVAPFSGYVSAKNVEIGSVINIATPIATITDISTLKLTIHVPDNEISEFEKGQKISINSDAVSGGKFNGIIEFISIKSDDTHNYPVKIAVKNQNHELKAGMFAYAQKSVDKSSTDFLFSIPRNALTGSSTNPKVYVVEGNKAVSKNVILGIENNDFIEIKSGLNLGDKVVVAGQINLSNGSFVTIKN